MKEIAPKQHNLWKRSVGIATVSLVTFFAAQPLSSQETGYYVTPFNDQPLEATIEARIQMGDITDRYCGDPSIDGYIGLHETALGIPYNTMLNRIVYLGVDESSVEQFYKLCVVDLVALDDIDERPVNSIGDVDQRIFQKITHNWDLEFSVIDPEVIDASRPVPIRPSDLAGNIYSAPK